MREVVNINLSIEGPLTPEIQAAIVVLLEASNLELRAVGSGGHTYKGSIQGSDEPELPSTVSQSRPSSVRWSRQEIDLIVDQVGKGVGYKKIAKLLNRTKGAVATKLNQLRDKGALPHLVKKGRKMQSGVGRAPHVELVRVVSDAQGSTPAVAPALVKLPPRIADVAPPPPAANVNPAAAAAVQFLNRAKGYSIFPRGEDRWLMNGLRVLSDRDVISKAKNLGFAG